MHNLLQSIFRSLWYTWKGNVIPRFVFASARPCTVYVEIPCCLMLTSNFDLFLFRRCSWYCSSRIPEVLTFIAFMLLCFIMVIIVIEMSDRANPPRKYGGFLPSLKIFTKFVNMETLIAIRRFHSCFHFSIDSTFFCNCGRSVFSNTCMNFNRRIRINSLIKEDMWISKRRPWRLDWAR
mgnify:CR=1 FL=1